MADLNPKKYADLLGELKTQRKKGWESHWEEIASYLLPRKGQFDGFRPNEGEKRHSYIKTNKPTKALRNLAALLQGGLTSPARPWFRLGLEDQDLALWGPVKDWLDRVQRAIYAAFGSSNFYTAVHSLYTELAGFGTGALYVERDDLTRIRCAVQTIGSYWVALNGLYRVDTIYRRVAMTAGQIVDRFGTTGCSDVVVKASEDTPFDYHWVIHVCRPRKSRDTRKVDAGSKAWESVYFLEEGHEERFLRDSGYDMFPFMVPRWDATGPESYGRSPGMDALPDVKQLYNTVTDVSRAIHVQVDPPLLIPDELKERLDRLPGGVTYYADHSSVEGIKSLYEFTPNIEGGILNKQDLVESIQETFYNDLLVFLVQRPNVTATEIVERHEEKLLLLGPVIERQQAELLDPLIDRVFSILQDDAHLPPPPRELFNMNLKVEYISLLAQAQKLVGTQAIEHTLSFIGAAAQVDQQAVDKLNTDKAIDNYAEMVGVPGEVIRTDDEVKVIRDQRAQQEQLANAAAMGKMATEAGVDLAGIKTNEQNALTAMMGPLGGPPI